MSKKSEPSKEKKSFVLNVDFYIENGLYVFTEKYHKDRGYCCGSGCRHCPYQLPVSSEQLPIDS